MKILKFYSTACTPCKMLTKVMQANTPDIFDIVEVDVYSENGSKEAAAYGVKSVPTLIIISDITGDPVARAKGNMTNREYVEFLEKALDSQ